MRARVYAGFKALSRQRGKVHPMPELERLKQTRRTVRLDTLVRLRWLSVIGQTAAVLVVYFGFEFDLPIWACLAVIALSAWLNIALRIVFRQARRHRAGPRRLAAGLRYRAARDHDVSHRRTGKSVRILFPRAGAALGDRAAAAHDRDARRLRDAVRDAAGVLPLSVAVERYRPAGFPGRLSARHLDLDPARDLRDRHLCVADRRGTAAIGGCASPRPNSCSRASSISRRSTVLRRRPRMRSARRCRRFRWSCENSSARSIRIRRMPRTSRSCASRRNAAATSLRSSMNFPAKASRSIACRCRR